MAKVYLIACFFGLVASDIVNDTTKPLLQIRSLGHLKGINNLINDTISKIPTKISPKDDADNIGGNFNGAEFQTNKNLRSTAHDSEFDNHNIDRQSSSWSACDEELTVIKEILSKNDDSQNDFKLKTKLDGENIKLELLHEHFETANGINCGLMYKVQISTSMKIKSFFVESVDISGQPAGNFVNQHLNSQLPASWFQINSLKNVEDAVEYRGDEVLCTRNKWKGNFGNKTKAFSLWLINEFCDTIHTVDFRIYVILASTNNTTTKESLYKQHFLLNLNHDCNLSLKSSAGILDYTILPLYSNDCSIYFPSFDGISFGQLPGYSIKLTRLNVPCNSDSYVQFTGKRKLCGKLEELHANDLYFHFNVNEKSSIRIHQNAMFSFEYRLVDYCYNKMITDKNSTFLIKPIRDSLECYFKIHLPYGYKINLTVITNYIQDDSITSTITNNADHLLNTNQDLHTNSTNSNDNKNNDNSNFIKTLNINNKNNVCNGIFLNIIENDILQLEECVLKTSKIKKLSYLSRSNILGINVQKISLPEIYGDIKMNTELLPSILLTYISEANEEIVEECDFGWISIQPFCVTTIETPMTWMEGEKYCSEMDGHLASIRSENDQKLIDQMVLNSPGYQNHIAYWVGGTDKTYEGDYKWSDGIPFHYSNWFPGWQQYNHYNKQPNDDGLSKQDCIELRKDFRPPPGVELNTILFSDSLMWNDRDCNSKNYLICEKHVSDDLTQTKSWTNDCNKTVSLTKEYPKATVWSPLFPREYPENANCYTTITAPHGFRIVLEFEELVIENEPGCSYDFLEITEPSMIHEKSKNNNYLKNLSKYSRHAFRRNNYRKRNSYESKTTSSENYDTAQDYIKNSFNLNYDLYKLRKNYLIKTPTYPKGNLLYQTSETEENLPKRICGDWSSKLKLLKYTSNDSYLGLHFVSDYSHHFGGYRAKVYMENSASACSDERLKSFGDSCYLFVSYPEVDWWTAQQICKGIGAQLSSVSSAFEHRFITTNIRNQADYTPQVTYWLGAELAYSGQFEWTDDTKMDFEGWFPGQNHLQKHSEPMCLGLQWKMSQIPSLQSGLYWESEHCRKIGGYVCKKKQPQFKDFELNNETVSGIEGRLTSPGYPGLYPTKTDYWVHVIAPERSRIIVQFQKIDLESQDECLYDFISIQNYDRLSHIILEPGVNTMPMAMLKSDGNIDKKIYDDINYLRRSRRSYNKNARKKKRNTKFVKLRSKKISKRSTDVQTENKNVYFDQVFDEQINQNSPSFLPYVRWCGQHDSNMSKFDFVSASNEIIINFHSDYSVSGLGFSATWNVIDMSGCPMKSLTSKEGLVSSPNYPHFLINNIDCTYVIQAPIGKKVLLEFIDFDIVEGGVVYIDIGNNNFQPYRNKNHINEGLFISMKEQIKIQIITSHKPFGRGFQAIYKTISINPLVQERTIQLTNNTAGHLFQLNYPEQMPHNIDFTQHLIAPLGEMILLEIYNVEFSSHGCAYNNKIEVFDYYADNNGTKWVLCNKIRSSKTTTAHESKDDDQTIPPVHITSYLNTIHILQKTSNESYMTFNASMRIQPDINLKFKLASGDDLVESCNPNPCYNNGKCITSGKKKKCQCHGHFTGRFCALNLCELEPCIFGKCELTANNFKCHCQPNYVGQTCEQKQKPCADNPCEGRGECFEKNGAFACRCHAWWEGQRCEKRMLKIPYKPLSERMLQEPFWLGLITVCVVLAFIGLVWCAKRHFPEKIEKLLAEEADRNRPPGSASLSSHHHTSLREQLQFTPSVANSAAVNPQPPKSILNRLGIRKPSLLSLSNPPGGSTARTFSLDDLLQPVPRRSPSPRKKRNNSTPVKKNAAEKKEILQQLVSPAVTAAKPKLTELIQMSENRLKAKSVQEVNKDNSETIFSEERSPSPQTANANDMKLEKKVTFALLLNKVSAEMSISSGANGNDSKTSSTPNILPDVLFRSHSSESSPCTNFTSATTNCSPINDDVEYFSSSELISSDAGKKINIVSNNRKIKSKASSADSILAMFRNFVPSTATNLPISSNMNSPSITPTISQDDPSAGEEESSLSSTHNSVSFSSGPPDSPVFYRPTNIEVPVVDTTNGQQKQTSYSNILYPPTVLLEIPSNGINKCLSPIKELPTPIPSPAITPIMPRPLRRKAPVIVKDDTFSASDDDDDGKSSTQLMVTPNESDFLIKVTNYDLENLADSSNSKEIECKTKIFKPNFPNVDEKVARPRNLIIPTLFVQQPSPTKDQFPKIVFSGSPPPQRASIGETSHMFPNKQQQKRLLKQLEKPASLDLCFVPPTITVTSNTNDLESETDPLSPTTKIISGPSHLMPDNSVGMCYLSPFSICNRGDRTISESNLSSSGYSSMASPGPSRCGSNNPLFPHEMDESGIISSNYSLHTNSRKPQLSSCIEKNNFCAGTTVGEEEQQRIKSDSETLSDDYLLESNDEGIGTDHIDEKIDDNDVPKLLELDNDLILCGKKILIADENPTMAHLQLPSIMVKIEVNEKGLSPVSSRSESPLSDRAGINRFSSHFYGEKDQQLPFTDSDGLYDFPSSDGKRTPNSYQKRSNNKKRERKLSKASHPSSPKNQLDMPAKDLPSISKHGHITHHLFHGNNISSRKSPKKRPVHKPSCSSSSSSTESLTTARQQSPRICRNVPSPNRGKLTKVKIVAEHESDADDSNPSINENTAADDCIKYRSRTNRLRAIGNQIRFLRRLEKSIKRRHSYQFPNSSSPDDDIRSNEQMSNCPLLQNTTSKPSALNNNRENCLRNIIASNSASMQNNSDANN